MSIICGLDIKGHKGQGHMVQGRGLMSKVKVTRSKNVFVRSFMLYLLSESEVISPTVTSVKVKGYIGQCQIMILKKGRWAYNNVG